MEKDLPSALCGQENPEATQKGAELAAPVLFSAPARRKPHTELARELGISDRTVRTKRARGMSDEEIAAEAQYLSRRHDPLKRMRDGAPSSSDSEPEDGQVSKVETGAGNPAIAEGGGVVSSSPALVLTSPASGMSAIGAASLRKEEAEAGLKELRLAEEQGRLIDLPTVTQELSQIVREVRDAMVGIAARLAPRVAAISDERQVYLIMLEEIEQGLHVAAAKVEQYERAA